MGIFFLFAEELHTVCQIKHNCYKYNPFQDNQMILAWSFFHAPARVFGASMLLA